MVFQKNVVVLFLLAASIWIADCDWKVQVSDKNKANEIVTFPYTDEVSAKFFMGTDLRGVVELRKSKLKPHKMPS